MPPIQGIAMGEYGAPKEYPGEPFHPADVDRVKPDTGCRYSPSCLSCPFPQCMQELPKGTGIGPPPPRAGSGRRSFFSICSPVGSAARRRPRRWPPKRA